MLHGLGHHLAALKRARVAAIPILQRNAHVGRDDADASILLFLKYLALVYQLSAFSRNFANLLT
ncbi:MAG: hypothetical protein ACYC1I_08495 [Acidimicrobiales bacterium]